MDDSIQLEVVTPEGKVFSSDVSELQFPTAFRGYYGILPDHTPVLTPLGDGLISCLHNGKKTVLTVFGGFAEVGPDHVKILARESETASSLDREAITKKLSDAENAVKSSITYEDQQKIQAVISACKLRLHALE
ncbi:MAG: ATP synthase F1 subunit epsilon [Holophagaceae bacterium]|nr:ATP synthase F1 subunit epsilon [Holophagaceae bacterium]